MDKAIRRLFKDNLTKVEEIMFDGICLSNLERNLQELSPDNPLIIQMINADGMVVYNDPLGSGLKTVSLEDIGYFFKEDNNGNKVYFRKRL